MYKLPFTGKNAVRARNAVTRKLMGIAAGAVVDDSDRVVEFAIPGLMDPSTVTVNMEHVDGKLVAVVRGEVLSEDVNRRSVWRIERTSVVPFEEHVDIPLGAVEQAPNVVLTIAKDACGNIDGGVLRLEWATATAQVPVEIRDCSPHD